MQPILSVLQQAFRKSILVLSLMIFTLLLSGLLIFFEQPSYASPTTLSPEEKIDRAYNYSEATGAREEERQKTYEETVEKAENPALMEKDYEKSAKAYKEGNSEFGLLEQAKKLLDKSTNPESLSDLRQ